MKLSSKSKLGKQCLAWSTLLLVHGSALAVNPVPGWYGGVMLGATYVPSTDLSFIHPLTITPVTGNLSYSVLGNIAGQVGYRMFNHYRVEGELLFNYNPYNSLEIGSLIITSPKSSKTLRMRGQTTTAAFMINGFYDFLTLGEESYFAPYAGIGIGYAQVKNSVKFYYNNHYIHGTNVSETATTPAAQFVLGLSYFMDDYTTIGMDYRYFTTKSIQPYDSRLQLNSINITLNGSFDCG